MANTIGGRVLYASSEILIIRLLIIKYNENQLFVTLFFSITTMKRWCYG